ncbi:MAG: hypothetical protein QM501_04175 [Gimesia sp.]
MKTLPAVASGLTSGNLYLHGWGYLFETDDVFTYDIDSGQFVKLADYRSPASISETLAWRRSQTGS